MSFRERYIPWDRFRTSGLVSWASVALGTYNKNTWAGGTHPSIRHRRGRGDSRAGGRMNATGILLRVGVVYDKARHSRCTDSWERHNAKPG